jgi:Ankyrin repeats (3 copies)
MESSSSVCNSNDSINAECGTIARDNINNNMPITSNQPRLDLLIHAVQNNEAEDIVINMIQQYPDNVSYKNSDDQYPLHVICNNQHQYTIEVIVQLVKTFPTAAVEIDCNGCTPLVLAIQSQKSDDIIVMLLDNCPNSINVTGLEEIMCPCPIQLALQMN